MSTGGPIPFRGKAHDMTMQENWTNTIKHKTDLVQEQLDIGLYCIKRYAFYLQKIVDIRRPALAELKRVTEYEAKEKAVRASKDGMADHFANYAMTQNILGTTLDFEMNFVNTLDRDVIQYILNWHKTAEKRLEATNKKLASVFAKQKELLMRIAKSRSECHRQWAALQAAWKEAEKADQQKLTKKNGMKDYETSIKKYQREIQKTYQSFNSFENEVREANEQQNRYWDEELPGCMREFEQLETDRLQVWGIAMEHFRNAQHEYFVRSSEAVAVLDDTTKCLDGNLEIKRWTDEIIKAHGLPRDPDYIVEHLPCEYTRVQQGDDLQHLLSIDLSVALAQRQQQQEKMPQRAAPAIPSLPPTHNFIKPQYAHCVMKALFNYPDREQDDLPLVEGDLVAILDMPLPPPGEDSTWWVAAHFDQTTGRLNRRGLIPSNYVTLDF